MSAPAEASHVAEKANKIKKARQPRLVPEAVTKSRLIIPYSIANPIKTPKLTESVPHRKQCMSGCGSKLAPNNVVKNLIQRASHYLDQATDTDRLQTREVDESNRHERSRGRFTVNMEALPNAEQCHRQRRVEHEFGRIPSWVQNPKPEMEKHVPPSRHDLKESADAGDRVARLP
jgi:hypothetical protein